MVASEDISTFVYLIPFGLIFLGYLGFHRARESRHRRIQIEQNKQGLTEPPSLHPVIDPLRCIGCSACIKACPEKNVLGMINGKAQLIAPTECIGHGACRVACPEGAIELVFGTERRGVDIPHIAANYETNVEGVYIAGELGGMGLIRNAVRQGVEAMASIAEARDVNGWAAAGVFDVIIVGAGPAGLAAALAAREKGLSYKVLEQDSIGGTVAHYPRGKIVMTAPMNLPLIGKIKISETTKEALLAFWEDTISKTGLEVTTNERVESISRVDGGLAVQTKDHLYRTRTVLLAIGRRGTPRKLDVPGEDRSKVVYRMIDPAQYAKQDVLVVGGGDSALEAACAIGEQSDTSVTLSYRGESFARAKPKNRNRLKHLQEEGRIDVQLGSTVSGIEEHVAVLQTETGPVTIENSAIIVCAGGILPGRFLRDIGIAVETKYGTA